MKPYKRKKKRNKNNIRDDINNTSKVVREDIYDLVKDCETKLEAEDELRSFFIEISNTNNSFKTYGKNMSVERIIDDLDSYKEWNG